MSRFNVTTAIPYVNGSPHVGHALELVQSDVLARHRRLRGDEVRLQSGTDDNALKNVRGAEAEGVSTASYVERVAERFLRLVPALELSFDDFVKTSSDPRHRPGVERLWHACAVRGDLYQKSYGGLYCVGCEQFYTPQELTYEGQCPEHGTVPEFIEEKNWFFRLSNYQEALIDLISTGRLRIEPASRKREILSFIGAGLEDFSVSRSVQRAHGWGIPVPGDPSQVVYVWFDALANYITGPGFGTDEEGYRYWWADADERVHVIGKGIIRFHAVYWPAMLLSAGLQLPDTIFVHEYLTASGEKISKSAGNAQDPVDIVAAYGSDALRWWLLSEVALAGDTDYTAARMITRSNEDLSNNLGNLVNRSVSMVTRYRDGVVPTRPFDPSVGSESAEAQLLRRVRDDTAEIVDSALRGFDFRRAVAAVTALGDAGNRYIEAVTPWTLAKAEKAGAAPYELDAVLAELMATCRAVAENLRPFLPAAANRIDAQCGDPRTGVVPKATPTFPRLEETPV